MTRSLRAIRLSLQTKVLLPVVACLVLLPAIIVWIADRHITGQALIEARQTLTTAETVFRNSLGIRTRNLASRFGNTVKEPRFKAVAQLGDAPTMTAFLRELLDENNVETEVMLFSNADGAILAGARRDPALSIEDFASAASDVIRSAGAGQIDTGMVVLAPHAFNVIAVPVFLKERGALVGTFSVGVRFSNQTSHELKLLTRTEILVLAGGGIAVSTIHGAEFDSTAPLSSPDEMRTGIRQVVIDGEHFFAMQGAFSERKSRQTIDFALLSSYEGRLRALGDTRRILVGVSAFVIALGVLIVWLAIRKITRPLRQLRDGAEAVGQGDFTRRIDVTSDDECGALAESFNRMTASLQTSRGQLETTVARLEAAQEQLVQRERRLRESEEGLRLIVEGVQDHAILTLDRAGRVNRWNPAAERLLGYAAEEAQGLAYAAFFALDDRAARVPEEGLAAAVREGHNNFEGWRVRRDGSRFWADVTLSPLPDADGAGGGFVEVARDITVRKKAEETLRTARDAAESASRAKSDFLANMSHEIRTPMNAIIGMTSLLLDEKLPPEHQEFAETIRTSANSLLEIIDDILDISKIEAGRLELRTQPFELCECLEQVVNMFAERCGRKHIEIAMHVATELPGLVAVDGTRLRQVLVNLVGNAVKFTEHGGITITAAPAADLGADFLRFTVEDTGIGIPSERLHRLFQPFSQVDSSTTRRRGGVGLGLAISRRLVELMDGSIEVESICGRGTLFRFTVRAPRCGDAGNGGKPLFIPLDRPRLLLVIEGPIARAMLKRQLESWNASVVAIRSVDTIPEGERIDLIIVDRVDADMAARIRAHFALGPLPVILLGSAASSGHGLHLERIASPVRPRELHASLHRLVDSGPKPVPVVAPSAPVEESLAARHPMSLLVVEDNAVNLRVIQLMLKRLGYTTDTAANGLDALECLSRRSYDAVFMDLQMPEMDGLTATRHLRRTVPASSPPYVMALTANSRTEDREACFAAGMHDFVSKPARLDKISEALRRAHAWLVGRETTSRLPRAG